jgi:hypothetical protein
MVPEMGKTTGNGFSIFFWVAAFQKMGWTASYNISS